MQFLSAGLLALSALFMGASASPIAQTSTHPTTGTYIKSVTYAGTGCPAGSVAGTFSTNFDNINIAFDKYVATIGPHEPVANKRKNCQITFTIAYPAGWSYSITKTTYKGFVDLDNKVTARQQSEYWFQGHEENSLTYYDDWKGYISEDYTTIPDVIGKEVWSPCKTTTSNLIVNTQIRLDNRYNPNGSGYISTDSLSHKVIHVLGCKWKRC